MKTEIFTAETQERLDVYLTEKLNKTRSAVKKLIADGLITVNGKTEKAGKVVKCGDEISATLPDPVPLDLTPENLPLDIVYQDEDVAVINKAQGVTVHAGNGTHGSTLVNALLYHLDSLSGINGVIRPGIVHRIDKDTSGLLVVAKNDAAHLSLSNQIKDKTCARVYYALVEGVVKTDEGEIETYIGRSDKNRTMMAVTDRGRKAITDYEVVKRYSAYTLMRFSLKTGRTHQIRVHCKYMGHPIVGDPVYGYKTQKFKLNGQLLHAAELGFNHPRTGERMTFTAPLPDYFEAVLKKLEK
ncbi:MAG: RluA family pseudouridine synthase [Candidatus Borkfalkiaceae bacterium]|nr:RluA family pseudouridine synthase [Christensenellaceae bacterium]